MTKKNSVWVICLAVLLGSACDRETSSTTETIAKTATTTTAATTKAVEEAPVEPPEDARLVLSEIAYEGEFAAGVGDPSGLPSDSPRRGLADIEITPDLASSLNDQRQVIVNQVLEREKVFVDPTPQGKLAKLQVQFGDAVEPNDKRPMTHRGLLLRVDLQRPDGTNRAASRQIPPANNSGELITNFDHTFNTLLEVALEQPE